MKIQKYSLNNNSVLAYYTNTTFEVNLLTNTNLVNGLGAIVCGRITSSFIILDQILRENNLISNDCILKLEIVNDLTGYKTIIMSNQHGELFYKSDTLHAPYQQYNGKTKMDVSNFMCPNDSKLLIQIAQIKENSITNMCDLLTNDFYWTSSSGNISDEFTLIFKKFGFEKTAVSVGVEYEFTKFKTLSSGALIFISQTNDVNMLKKYVKNITKIPQIKDIIKKANYNMKKTCDIIFKDFQYILTDEVYYSFSFKSFLETNYSKNNLMNAFNFENIKPNYAQIANVLYSHDLEKLKQSCRNASSIIQSHKDINLPVVGIFEKDDYVYNILLNLNLKLSSELKIINKYDQEFLKSVTNVLSLFKEDVNVEISFDNEQLKLSGSSLSLGLYFAIKAKLEKKQIRNDIIFSANLDSYGYLRYVSSLIYKVKCAIKYGYKYFVCSIENKKELEDKLLNIEKQKIKIIYLENVFDFDEKI